MRRELVRTPGGRLVDVGEFRGLVVLPDRPLTPEEAEDLVSTPPRAAPGLVPWHPDDLDETGTLRPGEE